MTLLHYLKRTNKQYGIVSLCIGTGMGAAAVYENPNYIKNDSKTIEKTNYFSISKL